MGDMVNMEPRIRYAKEEPDAYRAMQKLEEYIHGTGLDSSLIELMKIRASQLNGCAFCLDMHTQDARMAGETEQRIYCLGAWREAPFYTEQERAALALTESVTLIADNGVPDELYERVRTHFSAQQFVQLVMVINTINAWNRLSISTGLPAGEYKARPRSTV